MGKNKDRLNQKLIPWADSILDQVMNLPAAGGEDLTDTVAAQTTAVEELMRMVNRKIAMNNGEGQYVWKKCKIEQVTITNPSVVMNSGSGKIKVTTTDDIDLSLVDLFFFDGFVSSEPYKFYTQNGQLYFYSTSYPVTAYNTETHELTSNAGISNTTFTYTGTKEITKHVFEDYVVADGESTYPNGGELDGYWYELVDLNPVTHEIVSVPSMKYRSSHTIYSTIKNPTGVYGGGAISNGVIAYVYGKTGYSMSSTTKAALGVSINGNAVTIKTGDLAIPAMEVVIV